MEEDGNTLLSGPVVDGAASPINPSDLATLDGEYGFKNPPPIVPGGEGSGKVVAVGPGPMGRYFLGKRVACLSQGKGSGMWADFDQQLHDACHQADAHLAFDAVAGSMTLQLLDALPEHSKVTVYRCLSYEAAQAGADHLIFEDKAVDGFWMGPWINNMNLVQEFCKNAGCE